MKVYIVVELPNNKKLVPKIVGVFRNKSDAETKVYESSATGWRNIIEKIVE